MYLKTLNIVLFLWIVQFAQAQTSQVCARLLLGSGQDSITWQATPCANFGGYVVLGQENNSGPFIPLDTVSTTNLVHNNPNENTWHYQVGMLCNGVLSHISIAVSNQRPITPDLRSVSIVGNVPVIQWDPSPSPEVIGYQIYKESPYGSNNYFPYPTANSITNGTSFTDASAVDLLARYAIIAVSPCNKSLLGLGDAVDGTTGPHTSMIVAGSIDSCNQTISLNWNAYENWKDGVQSYEIWGNKNSSGFQLYQTVSSSTHSYIYSNAADNDHLVFQIRAVERNKVNRAISNNLQFDVRVNRPMDYIHITQLSVTTNNDISIKWEWDTNVDFVGGNLLAGIDSSQLDSRLFLPLIGSSLNGFSDNQVEPYLNSYYYRVQTEDACGHIVHSNWAKTIFLEVEALENFENKITWTEAYIEHGTVQEYWLYKIINGSPQRIAIVPATTLTYIDQLDVTNEAEAESCYFVIANMQLNFPNGKSNFTQSQSNKGCAIQGSNIHIPNAVSPNGENRYFRPIIVFGRSIFNYSMLIFDRYGQQIFESNDLYDAWDGTKDGQPLKMGMYVYRIRFQAPNLEWIERKGTVMLVR
ncbi:gliding motility-associated C-terminal domain-containing protein [Aureispira anguillae]|uniref:Gliding motility-associated C-terminal domain-containing protein n=1 Tax=Aureispira anguillae TaxID=2864201 RepID=A0A916DW02_9BACT|nr:gliding motility-associated C-terminal domain-containing protein [Aureispira anguillae]BDS14262.1 gliding motility-associated C-terminal domain-containing protein [Aureispira anguillae]